ncbi:MAG: DNA-directed RNA polymerase subunit beta', partial [Eubacterium sp.]|nr:DNA-directed RNA polymerase subunit beta' [Eubacterium sp.]
MNLETEGSKTKLLNEEFNFKSLQIGLASPEKIREWSRGEVKKPETINYRTLKPEKEGLFCEKIFGPTKDWECNCGKYKRIRHKGIVCENCGVEVTKSKVRRERMGHIELASPVSHIWYFKGIPSRMGLILEMSPRNLEKIIYFASYVVTDPGDTPLQYKQVLSETEYREARANYGNDFVASIGAEAIQELLKMVDLDQEAAVLKEELRDSSGQKKIRIARRLEAVEAFRTSNNKPEWMIMETIPVIPPELRPMVQLDGGRFATSDLNDLYRRVINRNNRLIKLLELDAPDIIVQNEKRMLQEAVDALIDNGRRGRAVTGPGNRPFKSLSDMLKGKQGRFRQNLLGKRVDYSGRSVIVVGPELKMYQCGLPKEMAIELFKPFVMRELVARQLSQNIKSAKKMVEKLDPIIWDVLEDVIHEHPVLLNRAPTLHRLGIQAFEPVLVDGRAIKLHPLACTAYNADFDGDQMAVHVPLSVEAQAEARFLMMACNNILKPQDGTPVVVPSQDMILGSYYMTLYKEDAKGTGSIFCDMDELEMAYFNHDVELHAKVKVRMTKEFEGENYTRLVESTVGRFIFNQILPQDMGFVPRNTLEEQFVLEVDTQVDKKVLTKIVDKCFKKHGPTITSEVLDDIKRLGYKFSTQAAITVGVADMQVPGDKEEILARADEKIAKNLKLFRRGLISEEERYQNVVDIWNKATDEVTDSLLSHLDRLNPITMMADSGARGSKNQIRQLAGMRGLMTNPTGRVIELPIRSNFREGLDVMEFFSSTHGARKGLADTALRTADSGYLTRRLVDVSQDVIVREEDCGTTRGYEVTAINEHGEVIENLAERIAGRYAFEDVIHPETGEVLARKDEVITSDQAEVIQAAGIEKVTIRAVFNCNSKYGVCKKCYGVDMTTWRPVEIGEAVGIIAAQSIGEPGTQLTMRTFHTGG